MTRYEDVVKAVKTAAGEEAILNNMIRAPLGSPDDDNFQVNFLTYLPSKIMFFSYGATFKVTYQYDSGPNQVFELSANDYKILNAPVDGKTFYATISDITVTKQNTASVVTTFN